MSKLNSLRDLFVEEMKDLYSAERQIIAALPKMAKAVQNEELRKAFETHLEETKVQVERIQQICEQLGVKPTGHPCKAMEGIIAEGQELLEQKGEPNVIDAALIGAAQRVEHYEIAAYGCARTYARILGLKEAEQMLQQTLDEESKTDELLTKLAESHINQDADKGEESGRETAGSK
ncbi:MAG TPA: ferritin-like domain-containing protein, partial [Fimbriimonadaceae bacterium]|nr:ferritin-like domain-containing protein [Fimbriimonadaceae bacterium]